MTNRLFFAAVIVALLLAAAKETVFGQTVEQRLGGTIGAVMVENARLSAELDAAKQTIAKLQAQPCQDKP
jgi:hypothetical protein